MSPDALVRRQFILRGTFALIIGLFLASNLVAIVETVGVRTRNHALIDRMLASLEQISRITHDVDHERLLIDEHIASEPADLASVEARLLAIDADYDAARRAFEPLATSATERATWEGLEGAIAATRGPIARAISLSRKNADAPAREVIASLQPRFEEIDGELDALIKITRDDGERTIVEARDRQQRATILLGTITVGGTTLALCLAMWVSRILRRRDELVRKATARLEQQNHELDAFAGRVAHDLRGPLTTISMSAATLSDVIPEGDRAIAILHRGIARMEALIHDLLELSHIEGPEGQVGQVATVARRLQEDLDPVVTGAHGALHVDVEPADVTCSDGLLRQALWNLGENAVKYRRTEAALELAISGHNDGRDYELRVADNGAGMSANEIRHAFDPFYRGDQVRAIPGTGLGLSIVKRIIEAAGGSIAIDSAPSCGTTFVIHLPLVQRTR